MSQQLTEIISSLDAQDNWEVNGDAGRAISELLPGYLLTKGFRPAAIEGLAQGNYLGAALDTLLLGNMGQYGELPSSDTRHPFLSVMVAEAYQRRVANGDAEPRGKSRVYGGTASDNFSILQELTSISLSHERDYESEAQRQFRRNGASRNLWLPRYTLEYANRAEILRSVPIAIVGAGASGIISAAYLMQLGFDNITLFDKRGKANGIWKQSNVSDGTKNNPFDIIFDTEVAPAATRGIIEGSGQDIDRYLEQVRYYYANDITTRKANVKSIEPGDLNHKITFIEDGEEKTETYPIVVYAPGIGSPLDPNDPRRMTTPHGQGEVGQRWQRQLSDKDIQRMGRRAVLIGIGNSTAEVGGQLQANGVDYRIVTHHDFQSIQRPDESIGSGPIYRDPKVPNLVKLAGDLPHIKRFFEQARDQGKIVPGVRHWSHSDGILTTVDQDGVETRIPFDSLNTLIGYGQKISDNDAMGLKTVDARTGTIAYDFDGEVQRAEFDAFDQPQRNRVYPGYFALGPILKSGGNPNAIVIPGIQHQVQFMAGTVLIRAAELVYGRKESKAVKRLARMGATATAEVEVDG